MILYSHRGNLNKRDIDNENKPLIIDKAINKGFRVEVDIRYINGSYWLGHDNPEYKVSLDWIVDRRNELLIHCKNLRSIYELSNCAYRLAYFAHKKDQYSLINNGLIWVDDISLKLNKKCIIPLIAQKDVENYYKYANIVGGICTDYPEFIK